MTAYNSAKHHIGLGPSGSQTGFTLAGGYRKDQQKEGQAQEFGGTFDLQESQGHSRWTQEDFSGGQYQYVWGRDPAMFRSCEGMRPMMFDRTIATTPPLQEKVNADNLINNYWSDATWPSTFTAYARRPFYTFVLRGLVYGVYAYGDNESGGVAVQRAVVMMDPNSGASGRFNIGNKEGFEGAYDFAEDVLYVENQTDRRIDRFDGSASPPTFPAATLTHYSYPNGIGNRRLVHMNTDGPKVTCIFGRMIVDLTIPEDITTGIGAASRYWIVNKRYRLPSFPVASCYYNNTLYLLCSGSTFTSSPKSGATFTYRGGWKTQVVSWNGTDLLPVVDFPYTFRGGDITEYAGRLFVSGWGMDYGDNEQIYGELYEVQASSIRSIRTFAPEHRTTTGVAKKHAKSINQLVVWEGLLWFVNEQGGFLEAYDITTDAFYGGPSLENIDYPGTDRIDGLVAVGSGLFVMTAGPGSGGNISTTPWGDWLSRGKGFRISKGSQAEPGFDATLETSDFAVEPARDKKWNKVTVMTKYGPCTHVECSTDGAVNWIDLTQLGSTTQDGDWYFTDWDASAISAKRRAAFKFWFGRGHTEGFTEFVAFTATFNFLTTGKKAWSLTVLGADQPELMDDTKEQQNIDTINDALFGWHANGDKLVFTDLDNTNYNVRVQDVSESQPIIGQELPVAGGSRTEAFYNITLLEI